jgi:hypothetical protein
MGAEEHASQRIERRHEGHEQGQPSGSEGTSLRNAHAVSAPGTAPQSGKPGSIEGGAQRKAEDHPRFE